LRLDYIFVPVPTFGILQQPSVLALATTEDMRPWRVGGNYDSPVARRIAEEAGLPRGSFADTKRAASAPIHSEGAAALSDATRRALAEFAAAEKRSADFPARPPFSLRNRATLKVARWLRADRFVAGVSARRKRQFHFDPEIGSLLLRWAVSTLRPRYAALDGLAGGDESR
jgi:hypothetical protein